MTENKALKILGAEKNMCQNRSFMIGDLEKCDDCRNYKHSKCALDAAIKAFELGDYDKVEDILHGN